ncbi:FG-GAP-like repeat-containing protein [Spirosoma agri]|uniref:T9SS type A sorting domain-containing protein n=1 Tax=Spirosoma agri TaxID=1987381 RepID=A0A6M0II58_9BACT|nr:FG-GAP-like repeat-containing protein [Spirosoma agri]NEU67918.1 T9SS type A sorting domain-containing protein [Spirosoma agri]
MKHHLPVADSKKLCKTAPFQLISEPYIRLMLIIGLVSMTNLAWSQCFTTLTNQPWIYGPSVTVGDFNGDGIPDLAGGQGGDHIAVQLGNQNGGFGAVAFYSVGDHYTTWAEAVGDFNGDGKLDIAVACFHSGSLSILLGDGLGGFGTPTIIPVGASLTSVAVTDFNKDGKLDLVMADYAYNRVSMMLGDGRGGFNELTSINLDDPTSPVRAVSVGDFNVDGEMDLAIVRTNSVFVSIMLGKGARQFGAATNYFIGSAPISIGVGDFNLDGKQDLAVGLYWTQSVSVALGNGVGGFKTPTLIPASAGSVSVYDLNADGRPDLTTSGVTMLVNCTGVTNTPPQPVVNLTQVATVDTAFSYTVNAFIDQQTPNHLTYTASIQPANGFVFDAATRTIIGTPISSGVSSVTITATDPGGLSASTSFSITASPASTTGLSIAGVTGVSCLTISASKRQLIFTPYYSGQKAEPITFWVANEMMSTTAPGPYSLQLYTDNPTITLMAQQGGQPTTYRFEWLASCGTTPLPPTGFAITGVTPVSCQAVSTSEHLVRFTPQYRTQSSEPISFSVANELMVTTAVGPYNLRVYADNPVVTLWAQQGNESATYQYNWLAGCQNGARQGSESSDTFRVIVLGNPVIDQVEIEVQGADQQPLSFQVLSEQGQQQSQLHIQQARAVERHRLALGNQAGIYLLLVTTPTQHKTLKLVKH